MGSVHNGEPIRGVRGKQNCTSIIEKRKVSDHKEIWSNEHGSAKALLSLLSKKYQQIQVLPIHMHNNFEMSTNNTHRNDAADSLRPYRAS